MADFCYYYCYYCLLPEEGSGKWLPGWQNPYEALCFTSIMIVFCIQTVQKGEILGTGIVFVVLGGEAFTSMYMTEAYSLPIYLSTSALPSTGLLSPLDMSHWNLWNTLFSCSAGTFPRGLRHFCVLYGKKRYSLWNKSIWEKKNAYKCTTTKYHIS